MDLNVQDLRIQNAESAYLRALRLCKGHDQVCGVGIKCPLNIGL
jgi:hypothetical protein